MSFGLALAVTQWDLAECLSFGVDVVRHRVIATKGLCSSPDLPLFLINVFNENHSNA